jgi:hypothetical protein
MRGRKVLPGTNHFVLLDLPYKFANLLRKSYYFVGYGKILRSLRQNFKICCGGCANQLAWRARRREGIAGFAKMYSILVYFFLFVCVNV